MANLQNRNDPNLETTASGTFSGEWDRDRGWWRDNFRNRPYALADRSFEDYAPGYRYAYETYPLYRGRKFTDIETDLRSGFSKFEARGQSTWENVKDAVHDAWDKLTGKI